MRLKLLDVDKFTSSLTPVTSTELVSRTGEPNPDSLFSEKIFGIEKSHDRSKKFSYFNLNTKVIHPSAYKLLIRIDKKFEDLLSTKRSFSLDSKGLMVPNENGVSGISAFIKMFPDINLKGGTSERDKIVDLLKGVAKDGTMFIDKLIVIPPDFRPMYTDEKTGRLVVDELNEIYINIMRKASQVKSIGKGSTLFNLLNYYLQMAVNDHDQFIRKKISKKHGLIRGSMLGKRIDFSARAVITPGPQLKADEIGVPLRIAVNLFQPFLIHYLLFSKKFPYKEQLETEIKLFTESELSVDTVNRVIKSIKAGDKIPDNLQEIFFNATEAAMKDRVVIAKRDPALHDGSYSAFYPVLIYGDVVQISTLRVGGFNADFDGDQMALFHPLTKQAQQEAKDKMMRGVGSKHSSHVTFELSKEMLVGLYIMTRNVKRTSSPVAVTPEILEKANDPYIPVKYKGKNTTMGRAIFNSAFPASYPFIDEQVTKKLVNGLIPELIEKYSDKEAKETFSKLELIGFKFATITAPSITLDMIDMPASILRIKEKLPTSSPEEAEKLLKEAEKIMIQHLKDSGLYYLIESGAGKGWSQPRQILIAKGVISDPKGNILEPIKGSFSEGLSSTEFFNAASGSRKGMADRSLNTATTGYFTRQLVYVLGAAEASPTIKDCKTKRTTLLRLTNDLIKRLHGRYIIRAGKLEQFNSSKFKAGDSIYLRSPIFCESKKICHTCYGDLLKRHKTPYVGILAGASIGERGTQLIMQTFHTGGATSLVTHNILQDILDNDPLITSELKKYLLQSEDKLVTLKPCRLTIDLSKYELNNNIQIEDEHIWTNHLISKIEYDDVIFNVILDYPVNVKNLKSIITGKSRIDLDYTNNDILLEVPMQVSEIKEQVSYVGRLLGGKVVFKDPSHLITKVMKVYGGKVSNLDLVHFEILISQALRDKNNQLLPARLGKTWDPVMMNIKSTVFASGFVQGLAFENIGKAIESGLISEEDVDETLLGKLVTGEKIV